MSKSLILEDIYTAVARRLGITKADTERVVDATLEEISNSLRSARPVAIRGFGSFDIRRRKARFARNPRKPEELVELPSRCVVLFKPSPVIKFELIQRTVSLT